MKELIELLKGMNSRERKSAKKYFSRYYADTKELKLFNLVELMIKNPNAKFNYHLKKLGYHSIEEPSFQKLKSRLKNKIIEYLISADCIREIRKMDKNAFVRQKMKKLNLQSQVLIERCHFSQARDLVQFSIRLGEENDVQQETIDALNQYKSICTHVADMKLRRRIQKKISKYREMNIAMTELIDSMDLIRCNLMICSINDFISILEDTAYQGRQPTTTDRQRLQFLNSNNFSGLATYRGARQVRCHISSCCVCAIVPPR